MLNGLDLKIIRKKHKLSQIEFAKELGVTRSTIVNYESGSVIPDTKQEFISKVLKEKFQGNATLLENRTVPLTYISIKARASFVDMGQQLEEPMPLYHVTYHGEEDISDQLVIEVDGDSMEPTIATGTKVRCKKINKGDWQYLNSGVYVVIYGNYFVIKRVKNSPVNGIVELHSDNTVTGGTLTIPLSEIRKILKVIRIVDAPIL